MTAARFVSYLRVSTAKQGASGLGLDAQREAITAYLNGGCWHLLGEHIEVESGKRADRPALTAALHQCKLTGAVLVIARLDRLSRNVAFLANLMDSDVEFVAVDNPTATRFTLHILAAVAEHEAAMISARTKAALAAARARGVKLGGKREGVRPDHRRGTEAVMKVAYEFAQQVAPMVLAMRQEGLSLRQIGAALADKGVRTARGGAWSAQERTAFRRVSSTKRLRLGNCSRSCEPSWRRCCKRF
jgi:DNA invertase Pin-like site-specific DNA recombinase